jgi:hypothetical protein
MPTNNSKKHKMKEIKHCCKAIAFLVTPMGQKVPGRYGESLFSSDFAGSKRFMRRFILFYFLDSVSIKPNH